MSGNFSPISLMKQHERFCSQARNSAVYFCHLNHVVKISRYLGLETVHQLASIKHESFAAKQQIQRNLRNNYNRNG